MTTLSTTERTRHRRLRHKGRHDAADLDAVLRAGFMCHLGFLADGAPRVLPTAYGYDPAGRCSSTGSTTAARWCTASRRS